jgi:GNAT superfamily N-acetyltransferase
MGEAVLSATHPTWGDRMIAVTSSLGALGSRGELEAQLDRAERELEHNRNGREYPRFIYIHLPHIRSGVAKENVLQWVADYLHDHSQLAGVDVYLPKKGYEVADVVVQKFYRRVAVTRESIESTVDKMERLGEEVEGETDKLKERLELYRLRKSWIEILTCRLRTWADSNPLELAAYRRETRKIQELERLNLDLLHRTDELHPGENFIQDEKKRVLGNWSRSIENNDLNYLTGREPVSGMPEPVGESDLEARKYLFLDFFGYAMEVYLSPNRVENLIDLALVHAEVSDLAWKYEKGEVMLNGDIHRLNRVPLLAGAELTESFPVSDEDVALEADSGRFSFKIARVSRGRASQGPRSKERDLEIHLDHLFLPQKMRHQGIGRNFFGELIRLGKDLGAKGILSSDIRDEGRLKLALYGMQFAGLHEFRKLFHYFENFLHDHIRIPGFEGYDLSPLEEIRNPQQFAYAFFDPETRALNLEPPLTAEAREKYRRLPPHHLAGRLYLLSEAPSWDGIFDLRPESESLRIFNSLIASPPWEGQPPRRPDDN